MLTSLNRGKHWFEASYVRPAHSTLSDEDFGPTPPFRNSCIVISDYGISVWWYEVHKTSLSRFGYKGLLAGSTVSSYLERNLSRNSSSSGNSDDLKKGKDVIVEVMKKYKDTELYWLNMICRYDMTYDIFFFTLGQLPSRLVTIRITGFCCTKDVGIKDRTMVWCG